MKVITKSPQAYRDLIGIADYIAQDSLAAADHFLEAAETTFGHLAETPEIGNVCPFKNPLAASIRVWPVRHSNRYLVFYRDEQNRVTIIRVLHGARDWESLFDNCRGD